MRSCPFSSLQLGIRVARLKSTRVPADGEGKIYVPILLPSFGAYPRPQGREFGRSWHEV